MIAPPYPYLIQTGEKLEEYEHISLGAQNCASEAAGAYTAQETFYTAELRPRPCDARLTAAARCERVKAYATRAANPLGARLGTVQSVKHIQAGLVFCLLPR